MGAFSFLTSGQFWAEQIISAGILCAIVLLPIGAAVKSLRADMQEYADNLARDQRGTKDAVTNEASALRSELAAHADKLSGEHKGIKDAELGEQKVIAMLLDTMKMQTSEAAKREQELHRLHEENLQLMLDKSMPAEQEQQEY